MRKIRDRATKACLTCGERIAASARKCVHCEAYQDFRKHLPFSSTILSLIVALVAVVSQAAPAIRSIFHVRRSEISYAIQVVGYRRLKILAVNDGERSGSISSGLIGVKGGNLSGLTLLNGGGTVLLPPNSSSILEYVSLDYVKMNPTSANKCFFFLVVSDQNGLVDPRRREDISCGHLTNWDKNL